MPISERWYSRPPEEEEEYETQVVYERPRPLARYVWLALQMAFWLLCIVGVLYVVGPAMAVIVIALTVAYRLL